MPEISRFFGIIIRMFLADHAPPHYHVEYAGRDATIEIESAAIVKGRLPPRVVGLVTEWTLLHRAELRRNWNRLQARRPPHRIAPLE